MAEFVADCPRCASRQITFNVLGDLLLPFEGSLLTFEVQGVCRHCRRSTLFVFVLTDLAHVRTFEKPGSLTSKPINALDHFAINGFISIKDIAHRAVPEHLPDNVEACFKEGAACDAIGCHNAAAAMFRLCLDIATKDLLPGGDGSTGGPNRDQRTKLTSRLEYLFEAKLLPDGLQELAECVREDGNDGAHDGTLTAADAEDMIDFTVALL